MSDADTTQEAHWSLGLYLEHLSMLPPPTGAFDPNGAWEHTYDVFPIYAALDVRGKGAWSLQHKGVTRLKREPAPGEGAFDLHVASEVTFQGRLPARTQRTTASVRCAADTLGTPLSWEMESVALSAEDGSPVPLSHMRESGVVRDGAVELTFEGGGRTLEVSSPLTSNWSLFEAVQRLPRGNAPEGEFEMLEDLRLRRAHQCLRAEGPTEVTMAGETVRLYGYRQLGEGISPLYYWLDEQGRLLLAFGKVRAYIWEGVTRAKAEGEQ